MKRNRLVAFYTFFILSFISGNLAYGKIPEDASIPDTVRKFLEWEFHANVVNKAENRLPQSFQMEHFEIPLEAINQDLDGSLDPKILSSLITTNEKGEKFLRWPINPEDTVYHHNFESTLKAKKIPYERKKYFNGFLTASRSLLVQDPNTQHIFSLKVSTNNTGGWWVNKSFSERQVENGRLGTKLVQAGKEVIPYRAMKPLFEPAGFTLKGNSSGLIHQGLLIRDLGEMAEGKKYFLPGFSALHPEEGMKIAKMNGSDDPAKFWHKHFVLPLARAMAEFAAYHGLSHESAHMQQFVIELDEKFRPTGKILFRDFQDSNFLRPFFDPETKLNQEMLKGWYSMYKKDELVVRFGMFKARIAPPWLDKDQQRQWMKDYFNEFESTYSKITGIPIDILTAKTNFGGSLRTYITKKYKILRTGQGIFFNSNKGPVSASWQNYFNITRCFQGEALTKDGRSCKEVLEDLRVRLNRDGYSGCL